MPCEIKLFVQNNNLFSTCKVVFIYTCTVVPAISSIEYIATILTIDQ